MLTPSIPEGVLELQQVPATNLEPPSDEVKTDGVPVDTMKVTPPPKPQPQKTQPAKPVVPETEEYDDDIDDVRIVPTDDE